MRAKILNEPPGLRTATLEALSKISWLNVNDSLLRVLHLTVGSMMGWLLLLLVNTLISLILFSN